MSQWVSQWQGHLLSCSGQLKNRKFLGPGCHTLNCTLYSVQPYCSRCVWRWIAMCYHLVRGVLILNKFRMLDFACLQSQVVLASGLIWISHWNRWVSKMKTVLMSMNKWKQLGSMQHYVYLKYSKKSNKNPPTILYLLVVLNVLPSHICSPFQDCLHVSIIWWGSLPTPVECLQKMAQWSIFQLIKGLEGGSSLQSSTDQSERCLLPSQQRSSALFFF